MTYTDEQWKILEQAATGFEWYFFKDEAADRTVRYLQDKKLIDAKGNGTPAKYILTEDGKKALNDRAVEEADKIDRENKERSAEAVRLEERREDHAREDRQNRIQNHLGYYSAVMSTLSFLFGIFVEYRFDIVALVLELLGG